MKHTVVIFLFLSIVTCPVSAQDTVLVQTGWNIIGSLGSGIVPSELVTVPHGIITTAMYGYNPGAGYESSDTLEMGRGYWVKVSAAGLIIFERSWSDGECGAKRVTYDGFIYHTVQIGTQCWLEENLRTGLMTMGSADQTDNGSIERYCYANNILYCLTYGGLYQWSEAMQYGAAEGSRGICPPGWHIPTLSEYQTLSSFIIGNGNMLKAVGQGTGDGAGLNLTGFSALLSGRRDETPGNFNSVLNDGYFWSSTEFDGTDASFMRLFGAVGDIDFTNLSKTYGFSVRCLED